MGGKPLGHGRGGEGSVDVRSAVCLLERDWRRKSVYRRKRRRRRGMYRDEEGREVGTKRVVAR